MTTPRLRREPAPVRRPPQWCLNDFEMGPSLGEGKFSEVFVAREKKSGTIVSHAGFYVAIKAMNKQFLRDQGLEKQVEREIKLHARYDHPNILQFYGYFTNATTIYLVTELSDQGDLFTYFKQQKDKHLSEKYAAKIIRDVCLALEQMHNDGIIHRDLKPENILLCNNVAKLGDFGLATRNSTKRTTFCGTLDYIAPYMFERNGHSEKIDVWSVGVLAYELCFGRAPFAADRETEVYENIKQTQLEFPKSFSEELIEFISRALIRYQNLRPSISDLLKIKWLR